MQYFHHCKAMIATMHAKEQVIAPLLKEAFGMELLLPNQINTDVLGTFTGEVERPGSPIETLRRKCELILKHEDSELAIASEGSFGPHPGAFFIAADEEFVMLKGKQYGLEITGKALSTATNFSAQKIYNETSLLEFLEKVGFPEHAIILRPSKEIYNNVYKGLQKKEPVLQIFNQFIKEHGMAYIETDMRAMYNPTRMKVIAEATKSLIQKMKQLCPECALPGFDISDSITGLPCQLCGMPTRSIKSFVYACKGCGYREDRIRDNGKISEDPMYCDYCNP